MGVPEWNWLIDYASPYHGYMYAVKRHVYSGSTDYQRVDVVDTFTFGRCLVLDGKIQSSEIDEYIYHEILVHPPLLVQSINSEEPPREVLVMGGGEGAVLRELLKYPSIESIIMVDLDKEVVDLCKEYLPAWHENSFENSRVELLHMDARRYLEDTERKFDAIISDITEPVDDGPSYLLFTKEFYDMLINRLKPGGVLSLQAGSISLTLLEAHSAIRNTLRQSFNHVCSYHTFIPSFDSAWGFILATQGNNPLQIDAESVDAYINRNNLNLRFYDGETHRGMFSLPKDIRNYLNKETNIIKDESPVFIY